MSQTTTLLPAGTYPIGTYAFGPIAVPVGAVKAELRLDGSQMTDPALLIDLRLDFSIDGGATWATDGLKPELQPYPVRIVQPGGQMTRTTPPTPWPVYGFMAELPSPALATRRMRGSVVISGAPITTVGTLIIT
jgi:hypothetical protein